MQLRFATVDVFTTRQFGGNPLAVVLDGQGLSTFEMQAIAAEFNLSETTFVLPPRAAEHTAEVRIFTPRAEMPFAGHPNVGTAFVLARHGEACGRPITGDRLVFEEKAGLVGMDILRDGGVVSGARLAAPQRFAAGKAIAADKVSEACRLPAAAVTAARHAPVIASCGAPFVIAELTDRAALTAATPRSDAFHRHFAGEAVNGALLYVRGEDGTADVHCRMFAPLHGIPEDPATGSANVALAGLLASLRPESELALKLTILQGVDMGRPSLMAASATKRGGKVVETTIGGSCVEVMTGQLTLAR